MTGGQDDTYPANEDESGSAQNAWVRVPLGPTLAVKQHVDSLLGCRERRGRGEGEGEISRLLDCVDGWWCTDLLLLLLPLLLLVSTCATNCSS
jgi:hypothetical protein